MTALSRSLSTAFLGLCALTLSACAETQLASHYAKKMPWPGSEEPKGTYKVGNPYQVAGDWYYPKEDYRLVESGIASWYGPTFHGKHTANGEVYDQNELTAAHRTLPMPSLVRVTNLENGRAVVVRINDRGPFSKGRVIDLSKRGAELLGMIGAGTARVKLEVLEKESRQIAQAARQGADTARLTLTDLDRYDVPRGAANAPVERIAVASTPSPGTNNIYELPESLKTPTITVEELNAGGTPRPASVSPVTAPITGHVDKGRFLPDPVVTNVSVPAATGLFVQAGSFGVRDNADRLATQLKKYGSVRIDPATVNGKNVYRVKIGPIATVGEADKILAQVAKEGVGAGKVVR